MIEKNKNFKYGSTSLLLILVFVIFISLLAWITYGTFEGIIGSLAYLIIGFLNFFPWVIPFAGIPLGILDILDIFGFKMYNFTLNGAHLNSSWLTATWLWIISMIGSVIDIFLMYLIISMVIRIKI